jgi:hypothetical protein
MAGHLEFGRGTAVGFRRDGKAAHENNRAWRAWVDGHAALIRAAGLPPAVLRSRADWRYLLRYGYHCDGPHPNIDFRLEELSPAQRAAFREPLATTPAEDRRQCAAWHFVCPPAG